nr:MAG TPA: hypothetical protein [Caudoviricetes sp.]
MRLIFEVILNKKRLSIPDSQSFVNLNLIL